MFVNFPIIFTQYPIFYQRFLNEFPQLSQISLKIFFNFLVNKSRNFSQKFCEIFEKFPSID